MCCCLFFLSLSFQDSEKKGRKKTLRTCIVSCLSLRVCVCVCVHKCLCRSFLSPSLSFSLFEMQHLQMCLANCRSQLLLRSVGGGEVCWNKAIKGGGRGGSGDRRLTIGVRGRRFTPRERRESNAAPRWLLGQLCDNAGRVEAEGGPLFEPCHR